MHTSEEIMEEARDFIGQFISNPDIDADVDLFAEGLVNSLFAMQLVLFVEQKYGIKVENEDLDYENFKSLNTIVQFIQKRSG
ncbi:acyl carrier protein [Magnetococcales bacterium HHB-1]